jgi:N-ethylmaleimide reductase
MALFQPLKVGAVELPNRFIMAPLTRCRATEHTHLPTDIMVTYYEQRATAGLIIAEATMVAENQSAFWTEPGIYNSAQIAGWKKVTDAVHAKGGKIFLQIWHGGRACVPSNSPGQPETVAPSAARIVRGSVAAQMNPSGEKIEYTVPRALTQDEIAAVVSQFAHGAKNAIEAGFDGVEIHGANGYLIDEFLRSSANTRDDHYGGSLENRARFLLEVVDAVVNAIGADRVGLRLSPLNSYNDMIDSEPEKVTELVASKMSELKLAYLHLMRSDFYQQQKGDVVTVARRAFKGALIVNMGYTAEEAEETIKAGLADAVCFGVPFLANPDFVERTRVKASLNAPRQETFYAKDAEGYTDYPFLQ